MTEGQPLKTTIKFGTQEELQIKMKNELVKVINILKTQKSERVWLVGPSRGLSWCVELKEGGQLFTLSQRRYFKDEAKAGAYALKKNIEERRREKPKPKGFLKPRN